jgi:hypothetical protein
MKIKILLIISLLASVVHSTGGSLEFVDDMGDFRNIPPEVKKLDSSIVELTRESTGRDLLSVDEHPETQSLIVGKMVESELGDVAPYLQHIIEKGIAYGDKLKEVEFRDGTTGIEVQGKQVVTHITPIHFEDSDEKGPAYLAVLTGKDITFDADGKVISRVRHHHGRYMGLYFMTKNDIVLKHKISDLSGGTFDPDLGHAPHITLGQFNEFDKCLRIIEESLKSVNLFATGSPGGNLKAEKTELLKKLLQILGSDAEYFSSQGGIRKGINVKSREFLDELLKSESFSNKSLQKQVKDFFTNLEKLLGGGRKLSAATKKNMNEGIAKYIKHIIRFHKITGRAAFQKISTDLGLTIPDEAFLHENILIFYNSSLDISRAQVESNLKKSTVVRQIYKAYKKLCFEQIREAAQGIAIDRAIFARNKKFGIHHLLGKEQIWGSLLFNKDSSFVKSLQTFHTDIFKTLFSAKDEFTLPHVSLVRQAYVSERYMQRYVISRSLIRLNPYDGNSLILFFVNSLAKQRGVDVHVDEFRADISFSFEDLKRIFDKTLAGAAEGFSGSFSAAHTIGF